MWSRIRFNPQQTTWGCRYLHWSYFFELESPLKQNLIVEVSKFDMWHSFCCAPYIVQLRKPVSNVLDTQLNYVAVQLTRPFRMSWLKMDIIDFVRKKKDITKSFETLGWVFLLLEGREAAEKNPWETLVACAYSFYNNIKYMVFYFFSLVMLTILEEESPSLRFIAYGIYFLDYAGRVLYSCYIDWPLAFVPV